MYEYSALKLNVGPVPEEAPVTRGHRMKLDIRKLYHPKAMRVCETESDPEEKHLAYCAGHPNIVAYCSRPGPGCGAGVDGDPSAWRELGTNAQLFYLSWDSQ